MDTKLQSRVESKPASFTPVRGGLLQRKCACADAPGPGGECEACRKRRGAATLQRAAGHAAVVNTVPPIVHEVLGAPGQPLDSATRAFMEPRFGHDFSHVRVHTDARAAESAKMVDALAYTVGRHVVFGAGRLAPGTNEGRRLVAHELTHVLQQANGLRRQPSDLTVTSPNEAAETEAGRVADAVLGGYFFNITSSQSIRLARTANECTYGEIRSWAITSQRDFTAPAGLADAKASIGSVCSSSNCNCVDGSGATAPGDQHAWSNIVAATGGSDLSGGGNHMCVGHQGCTFVHRCSCPDGRVVERVRNLSPSGTARVAGKGTLYFYDVPRRGQCPQADREARCGQRRPRKSGATGMIPPEEGSQSSLV